MYDPKACSLISYYAISGSGSGCDPWHTFEEPYYACFPAGNTNLIYQNGVKIILDNFNGLVLRNAELAREYDSVRFGVSTAQVPTYPCEVKGCCKGGGICDGPNVDLTNDGNDAVVDHEFGHHFHWTFAPSVYHSSAELDEGYAQWHQFAVRNYANRTYGDADNFFGSVADDPEQMPFQTPSSNPPRYIDAYTASQPPYPNEDFYDDMMCFLWNVYDKVNDPQFLATIYDGADNDDIGEPLLAFTVMKTLTGNITDRQFANDLEAAVSSKEAASIEDVYQFTMGNGSHPMRPAQITGLTGSAGGGDPNYVANLSWTSQDYTSGAYINPPSGIHIEKPDGTVLKTLSATATSTTMGIGAMCAGASTFVVTAFNSSGDSYNPPSISVGPPCAGKIAEGHTSFAVDSVGPDITVHPNPAGRYARICVSDLPAGTPVTLIVVNEAGEIVSTLYNATPDAELGLCCTLDCSRLPNGTYFARLWNDFLGQSVKLSVQH